MKLAKHFPLSDHFINFHSFFSWWCRVAHVWESQSWILNSKPLDSGFHWGTGFRILIVSGLRIPRVVFRSPKPRILDSMGKTFLDSRFHEQKFPGFRGRILYNGAIRENWCWSLLRLNGLRRKPKLNRLCYNSAKNFGIWNISSKEPGEARCADGVWEPKNHLAKSNGENDRKILTASTMCCSSWSVTSGANVKWKNEQTVCLQSERLRHIEQWIQSIRLWIWFEIGRG